MKKVLLLGIVLALCPISARAENEGPTVSDTVESSYEETRGSDEEEQETAETSTSSSVLQQESTAQVTGFGERSSQENGLSRAGESTVEIDKTELPNGKFKLIFIPQNSQQIKSIRVPIWSDPKQKDIVWYSAVRQTNGRYVVEFDYKKHQFNTGKYSIHVYTMTTDNKTKVTGISPITVNQPVNTDAVFKAVPMQDYKYYRLSVELKNPNVQGVTFPAWSGAKGQDDLRWYTGKYDSKTKLWYVDIPMDKHKDAGAMVAHTYINTSKGLKFNRGDTFMVPKLAFTSAKIEPTNTSGRFKVVLQVNQPGRVDRVRVPIWSEKNGQDDIKWYSAVKQSNGSYTVDFDYKNHKYDLGKYFVHAYLYSNTGQTSAISVADNIQVKEEPIKGDLTIAARNTTKTVYRASVKLNTAAKSVLFPTWTNTRGQDDMKWYQGKYDSKTNTWYADIEVKNHRDGGLTQTHVWATTATGMRFVTNTTFNISKPALTEKVIDMSQAENGQFKLTLTVNEPGAIEKVRVPIWTNYKGQDDIKWYTAVRQANGTFTLTVDTKNHNYETGRYVIHAYIYGKNGLTSAYSVSDNLQVPKFKLHPKNLKVEPKSGSSSLYRISVELPSSSRIKKVRFPTWTNVMGQDDIKWYNASYDTANKIWYADIDLRKSHWNGTNLITHAYVDVEKEGLMFLGSISSNLPETSLAQYINHRGNHKKAPENSIPSFEQSNYFAAETDIQLTADGRWVVMHDATIDRMTNGSGYVAQMTFDQIRNYRIDAGNNVNSYSSAKLVVPTLEEFLSICKAKGIVPVIEIKIGSASEESYDNLISIVEQYDFGENVKFISFYLEPLQAVKSRMPNASTMYLTADITDTTIKQVKALGNRSGLNIVWANVTADKVKKAKAQGLSVGAWTVPESKITDMRNAGVDYITTDD
ncbi:GBS Bsp-like repeat-containing protein [Enterococcus larvae]|uniref:GBS Bsp-like repeat-containing protein n=1 Tax=Enterococcus larvae TaxID=2794352 RepID=UPI003F35FD7E